MEILEAFYRRKLKKKTQKRSAMFSSEVELNRASSLASVGNGEAGGDGGAVTTGLITRVLHLTRRREPRPHSWHSTKLGDGSTESVEQVDRMDSVHSSTADLFSSLDSGGGVKWSLESLEPAQRLGRTTAAHLGPRSSSSCLQLSSTRSSSIDLRHSKREAAHSSSTSLSFPECHDLSIERSFSLETVPQTEDLRSAHDLSLEQDSRARVRLRQQTGGGPCYHDSREDSHSLGSVRGSSCESLKGALAPPRLSESCTTRKPERPSSWSSLEGSRSVRSLRSQQRGSWHHSSSSLASGGPAKGLYMTDGPLHTVMEKSPESSPSSRPRQAQSPGAPQEPLYSGLYPLWLRDNQTGHQHRVAAHSYRGSLPCRSLADPQTPPTVQGPAPTSALPLPHHSQLEHPLTRLEMALAEVQGSGGETFPAPGVSVLEKVSCFEHREWATRQHGLSNRHRSGPKQVSDQSQKTLYGAEDLKNKSEMRPNVNKACRTLSHTGVSHETNRDGEKNPQPKVFRSASFRGTSWTPLPPPPIPPKVLSYRDKADTPSAEKKGPKTLPKPHSPSPNTVNPPAPPSPDPPTPAPITRICGRKRLTSEQKRRSFSEPESMNEIGLTRSSGTAPSRHAGDPSVADRRRMFELAARGGVGGAPVQELLLGHEEKNLSQKREGRSQKSTPRPFSAVFPPTHTHTDSVRLASSSSLLSLTDCTQEPLLFTEEGPLSSALAPGGHLRSSHSTVVYPGRVTSPRAPAAPPHSYDSSSSSLGEGAHQSASVSHSLSLSQEVDSPQQTSTSADHLPQRTHSRCLSIPAAGTAEQSVNTSSGVTFEEESVTVAVNRAEQETSAHESSLPHSSKPATPSVSAPRRERPRRSSRSALAASVGLPCPLSPTGPEPSERRDTLSESGGAGPEQQLPEPTGQTQDKARSFHGADNQDFPSAPVLKTPPPPSPQAPALTAPRAAVLVEDSLALEYEPVSVRIQSPEERRVLALLRTLVCADHTLAPLMDMWGKSTVDVLKEIFPNSRLVEKLAWQHSELLDDWSREPPVESLESSVDIISRKVELCETLRKCSESLQREKEALSDAFRAHTELGRRVEAWVREHCEDSEKEKYHTFIGDLERVVNLLLSLCGRLARIERSLASLRRQEPTEGSTELWDSLIHKQTLLLRQTQEALELRDHLERRQCTVHGFLRRRLAPAQLQQYRRLVRSTPAALVDLRRLDDLLRQTQETLSLLLDTVPLEVTQARGWSRVGLALTTTPLFLMRSQAPPIWYSGPTPMDCPVTVTSL